MTAAQTIAAWATALSLDDVPDAVRADAKLHVLDTIGCGLAAHATGVAHEGRTTMAELGGVPHATVLGSGRGCPRRTPPSRTRCSATASTSTTRTPTRSATSRP